MSERVVVAGYGNPLRGDDGAGWQVADAIARRWGERITVLTGVQPLPEWSVPLGVAEVAFFVDAGVNAGGRLRLRAIVAAHDLFDGHTMDIEHLLGLTRSVYGQVPTSYALELPLHEVGFSEHLSPETARAVTSGVRLLNRRLARLTLLPRR